MQATSNGSPQRSMLGDPAAKKAKAAARGTVAYPAIRQRGYYSDIITQEHLEDDVSLPKAANV